MRRAPVALQALAALCAAAACAASAAPQCARRAEGEACPPAAGRVPCCATEPSDLDYGFYVDGEKFGIRYSPDEEATVTCSGNVSLDSAALPRFQRLQRVRRLALHCAPPAAAYAAVLRALRLQLRPRAALALHLPPGARALAPAQLAGLRLQELRLAGDGELPRGLFAELPQLEMLRVEGFTLRPRDLLELPPRLLGLALTGVGGGAGLTLPAALLRPALAYLVVRDEGPVALNASGTGALRWLSLGRWAGAAPWVACGKLQRLVAEGGRAALAPRWLAACGKLRELRVFGARLQPLPPRLLQGAAALADVSLADCALRSVPADLLAHTPRLRELDLSRNELLALPEGFFLRSPALKVLNLSGNRLGSWAALRAGGLPALPLHTLRLGGNPLGDACAAGGDSPLRAARALRVLDLRAAGLTRLCRDWRRLRGLELLELYYNNVTQLKYEDLQFDRGQPSTVYLTENAIRNVSLTAEEYRLLLEREREVDNVTVYLEAELHCDCEVYYTALALRDDVLPGRLGDGALRCVDGAAPGPLRRAPLVALQCEQRAGCPARCDCRRREGALHVRCEPGSWPALGALPALPLHVHLADNGIRELPAAALPANLKELDLRNNSLAAIGEAAARALLADGRRVWLAGNPLLCACDDAAALRLLERHRAQVADYARLQCPGGGALEAARRCGAWRLGAAAAALALALLALGALGAAHPGLRRRLKALLGAAGRAGDEDLPFDAFVSYAHEDRWLVTEMVARLEVGPRPYRLCVHARDWVPGEWIPAQIEASVRASRRTLAVVSERSLRSPWARAELLAALEARRLLVVLLLAPAAVRDEPLRAHLAAHTYLRWGDPYFWRKLRKALPPPRRPAAPAASSAPDTSPAPAASSAPDTSPAPAASSAPDTSPAPATSWAPDTSPAPAASSAPDTSPAPAASSAPTTLSTPSALLPANPPTITTLRETASSDRNTRRKSEETPLSGVKLLSMSYYEHERPITPATS